jgi:hypothetical protein
MVVLVTSQVLGATSDLLPYDNTGSGFAFQYPTYWTLVTDVDRMISIQDGSIDLIRQEDMTASERESYKAMVHVDGNHRYISNVVIMAYPHSGSGGTYRSSEDAVQALRHDFETKMASGTYFLEETYLGESHAFTYRRTVPERQWSDSIRITYYLTASRTTAYMVVETVLLSHLDDAVYRDQFNQVVQSFRVTANETTAIDPSLDWGAFKPGEATTEDGSGQPIGKVVYEEDFNNNDMVWPTGDYAKIHDGSYVLDSRNGYPFTMTNTGLGRISFDFSYEGEVRFLDGNDDAGYGLVFGYQDKDNYYAFLINEGGRFMVVQEKDSQVRSLVPWTETAYLIGNVHDLLVQGDYQTLNEGGITHRYSVIFYIDGNEVSNIDINDILGVSGTFGVFVSEDLNVAFDSLIARNYLLDSIMTLDRIVR